MPDDRLSRVETKLDELTDMALSPSVYAESRAKYLERASHWANIEAAYRARKQSKQEG